MKVFIDIQAPPDVQFFKPVINALLSKSSLYVSARDYAETYGLLDLFNIKYDKIGSLSSGNNIVKTYETIKRTIKLYNKIKDQNIDVTISFGNLHSIYASKLDKTPCITIMDNELGLKEITPKRSIFEWGVIKSQIKFSKYILVPEFFPKDALIYEGISPDNVFSFEGYKENIYLSEYSPDPNFLDKLPFEEFLV